MPNWLPALIQVFPWPHNMFDILYGIFCREIRDVHFLYLGHDVWFFRDQEDGKEAMFWHLTSRKPSTIPRRKRKFFAADDAVESDERVPDYPRCERLSWVRPVTENAQDAVVLAWDYREDDGSVHSYAWLKDENFVVVLKKMRDGTRRLITSYYVDFESKRKSFERKYNDRVL